MQRGSVDPDYPEDAPDDHSRGHRESPGGHTPEKTILVRSGPAKLHLLNQPWPISQRPQPSSLSGRLPYMDATGATICEYCLAWGVSHQEISVPYYKNSTVHVIVYEGNLPTRLRGNFDELREQYSSVGQLLAEKMGTELRSTSIDSDRKGLSFTFTNISAVDRLLSGGNKLTSPEGHQFKFHPLWCSDWRGTNGLTWLPGTSYGVLNGSLYSPQEDPEPPKEVMKSIEE